MPHHVPLVEEDEPDPRDAREQLLRLAQTRGLSLRQVHLSDIARDHCLRAKADARQEHPHLLGGRVLRLVENDERVVQGPAAHEGDRRDLDDAALEQLCGLLVAQDVVERVVEGAQVGIDLFDHVARQEAQPFPRLDRGPGQHDALDLLLQQGRGCHRHGQVSLAGAGRADREDKVVVVDRLDVEPLLDVASRHDGLERRAEGALQKEFGEGSLRVFLDDADRRGDVARLQGVADCQQLGKGMEQAADAVFRPALPHDRDLVAAGGELHAERILDGLEVLVGNSEKLGQPGVGKRYGWIGVRNGLHSSETGSTLTRGCEMQQTGHPLPRARLAEKSRGGRDLASFGDRLGAVLQAVFHGVVRRRAL